KIPPCALRVVPNAKGGHRKGRRGPRSVVPQYARDSTANEIASRSRAEFPMFGGDFRQTRSYSFPRVCSSPSINLSCLTLLLLESPIQCYPLGNGAVGLRSILNSIRVGRPRNHECSVGRAFFCSPYARLLCREPELRWPGRISLS